jgi:hypothetical protein
MAKALFSNSASGSDSSVVGIVSTSDWSTAENLVSSDIRVVEISDTVFNNIKNGTTQLDGNDGDTLSTRSDVIANETQELAKNMMEAIKQSHIDTCKAWIDDGKTYLRTETQTYLNFLNGWDTSSITWPTDKTFEQYLESISQDYVSPLQLCL